MISLCPKHDCTGCAACVNKCKKNAISFARDIEGFFYPLINVDLCVECGSCLSVCPILQPKTTAASFLETYAVWSKEDDIRRKSSSGGFFSVIAQEILNRDGVVVGASFDGRFNLNHVTISKKEELSLLQGSKYLQSNTAECYRSVKCNLAAGKWVLFSGTPCQIAGLLLFLDDTYDKLITLDLVCHGVPSPMVFHSYIQWLEKKYNSKVESFIFRDKKWSWNRFNVKASFSSGDIYYGRWEKDPYMRGFLREYYLRPSCHNCHFSNLDRVGDVTIADFWGYADVENMPKNKDRGVSLLIVHSEKGKEIFEKCKNELYYSSQSILKGMSGNRALSACFPPSPIRGDFWNDYQNKSFDFVKDKYLYPESVSLRYKLIYALGKNNIILKFIILLYEGLRNKISK